MSTFRGCTDLLFDGIGGRVVPFTKSALSSSSGDGAGAFVAALVVSPHMACAGRKAIFVCGSLLCVVGPLAYALEVRSHAVGAADRPRSNFIVVRGR